MIRLLLSLMLLHHIPGQCAPGDLEDEHSADGEQGHDSDGRIRQHLLGTTGDVVADMRERMITSLQRQIDDGRADLRDWAAREIEQAPPARQDALRDVLEEIQEQNKRQAEKALRQAKAIENKQQPRWPL